MSMVRVQSVVPLESYLVRLGFTDGTERVVDLEPYLRGPIFEPLRDEDLFRSVRVDEELGTIVWPTGADIDPDVLYESTPAAEVRRPMANHSQQIVQRLWNYCNILRDDGLSYGDYLEQLTFLLFLKMADEQSHPPFNKKSPIPEKYSWPELL